MDNAQPLRCGDVSLTEKGIAQVLKAPLFRRRQAVPGQLDFDVEEASSRLDLSSCSAALRSATARASCASRLCTFVRRTSRR